MKEAYCSYEISKLLKKKGFNEKTLYHYTNCDVLQHNIVYNQYKNSEMLNACSAPTHQMAMAWLREKHNICIIQYPDKENGYEAVLYDIKNNVEIVLQSFGVYGIHIYKKIYEDAVESAIKYCLENLI